MKPALLLTATRGLLHNGKIIALTLTLQPKIPSAAATVAAVGMLQSLNPPTDLAKHNGAATTANLLVVASHSTRESGRLHEDPLQES